MSRLAKKSIQILAGTSVKRDGDFLIFKGEKGEKRLGILPQVDVRIEGDNLRVDFRGGGKHGKSNQGTMWSLIKNDIAGVQKGFTKILEIEGVGYRVLMEGKNLLLHLGYAEPVRFSLPEGVSAEVEKNSVKISGVDKVLVGRIAADIRALKKPEPYKGKGMRYRGEFIRRKVGKKASATTTS